MLVLLLAFSAATLVMRPVLGGEPPNSWDGSQDRMWDPRDSAPGAEPSQKLINEDIGDMHHVLHPAEHKEQYKRMREHIAEHVARTGSAFKGHIPEHLFGHFMTDDEL
jgi:hypothetical protein